ncbi:MAG: hypothetical protein AAFP77_15555 [Bacteroidota bacterium]
MKNSATIAVLKTLDKKECRELHKWLSSPFFNQRQDVLDLFQYLMAANHLEEDKFLEKERIYRKLFPKESYDDAKFRQTIHFLHRQLERFLAFKEIDNDEYAYPVAYLKSLRRRKVSSVFQKKFNALRRAGLGQKTLDSTGLRNSLTLYDEYSSYLGEIDRTKDIHLQDSISAFDALFIAEKLKFACHTLSHQQVFKTEYKSLFLQDVVTAVETQKELLDYPAIAIYYYLYLILSRPDADKYYFALKSTLYQYIEVFSALEQRDFHLMALNYCIQRINRGAADFIQEAFEIYQYTFERKLILENGVLSRRTFLNAILAALRLKEFAWAEATIENYAQYVEEEYREVFSNFCWAKLAFERHDYPLAHKLLVHFDPSDLLISLNAKTMLLKIYYEATEYDALDSLLESMRVYLKRKNVIGYHRDVFQNMLTYTKKLVRLNPYDKKKRIELRTEIEQASPLTDRPWLLEQIDKMG